MKHVNHASDELLERSWRRAWSGLGAHGDGIALRDELLLAWATPGRSYHTLRHLHDCISLLEPVLAQAAHAAEVEVAIWFHDAIYDPRAPDNEARSADWAARALAQAGVAVEACARVSALVMATRHAVIPQSVDEELLVDVDLAILGAAQERFDEYEVEVREEYAWVPGPVFRHKRRQILAGFLARPHLYSTGSFRSRFEARGRDNLRRAMSVLRPWWRFW
jgi:predicted metal-dependent HD superfamily phosphohydrolase